MSAVGDGQVDARLLQAFETPICQATPGSTSAQHQGKPHRSSAFSIDRYPIGIDNDIPVARLRC
jgi:hypothetical protein